MEEQIVGYFGEDEIKKSPMFANTTTSEYEAAETYESPLAFIKTCIADYPNEIKLDAELSMCKLAMFLHLDCSRFVGVVRQRLLDGHLDFMYIEFEKTFKNCIGIDTELLQIAFFLHTLQFSSMQAVMYCQNVVVNVYVEHISFKRWVFASFPIFKLFYSALKNEGPMDASWFYDHVSECVLNFKIDFAPFCWNCLKIIRNK